MRHQKSQKRKSPKDDEIPPDIDSLIEGRTVTISDNDRFFAKQWKAMLPVVGSQAKQIGHSFELKKSFFERFKAYLRVELWAKDKPQYEKFKPTDWIAQALYKAAEELVPDESKYMDDRLWPDGRPNSEAWQRCKNSWLWNGIPRTEILEDSGQGAKLLPITPGPIRHPRVEISADLSTDRTKLPAVTISIRGELACLLMNAAATAEDLPEKGPAKRDAKRLWDFVSRRAAILLGIEQPTQGKPASGLGEQAAWLHDHAGLSWAQVALKLCPQKHQHDSHCTDNYKQQAKQFWKRERGKYEALSSMKAHVEATKPINSPNKEQE